MLLHRAFHGIDVLFGEPLNILAICRWTDVWRLRVELWQSPIISRIPLIIFDHVFFHGLMWCQRRLEVFVANL